MKRLTPEREKEIRSYSDYDFSIELLEEIDALRSEILERENNCVTTHIHKANVAEIIEENKNLKAELEKCHNDFMEHDKDTDSLISSLKAEKAELIMSTSAFEIGKLRAELKSKSNQLLATFQDFMRIAKENETLNERMAKLREALEGGLRGLTWFLEGPYGEPPSEDDLRRIREIQAKDDSGCDYMTKLEEK